MHLRNDPLAGAAEVVHWLEQRCTAHMQSNVDSTSALSGNQSIPRNDVRKEDSLVCTVGAISVWPGASNVIAGSANISIDVRSVLMPVDY